MTGTSFLVLSRCGFLLLLSFLFYTVFTDYTSQPQFPSPALFLSCTLYHRVSWFRFHLIRPLFILPFAIPGCFVVVASFLRIVLPFEKLVDFGPFCISPLVASFGCHGNSRTVAISFQRNCTLNFFLITQRNFHLINQRKSSIRQCKPRFTVNFFFHRQSASFNATSSFNLRPPQMHPVFSTR